MRPPVCRVCLSEHRLGGDHIWKAEVAPLHEVLRVKPAVVDNVVVDVALVVDTKPVTVTAVVDKSRKSDRHSKVRTEYFREQKRAWRAKQKAV